MCCHGGYVMTNRSRTDSIADPSKRAADKDISTVDKQTEHVVYEEIIEKQFDASDQEVMCINEHERFRPSSKKVAHALVYATDQGIFASQYDPPTAEPLSGTQIRPVEKLEIVEKAYGANRGVFIRGSTPNGTEMIGKRKLKVVTDHPEDGERIHDLWRMSPSSENLWKGEYFWGVSADHIPLFRTDLAADQLEELQEEQEKLPTVAKHKVWKIDSASVLAKALNPKRSIDQNRVMHRSAFDEAHEFYQQHVDPDNPQADELHPERSEIFKKNAEAKNTWRGGSVVSQYRHEWLHAMGHSLVPADINPQTVDNLASGPKWMNSEMMVNGERTAKWVALHRPQAEIDAECKFELIKGSDIIEQGDMRFTFKEKDQKVELQHHLNPWRKFVTLPKPSDNAQTTLVVSKLLAKQTADRVQTVVVPPGVKYMGKLSTNVSKNTNAIASSSIEKVSADLACVNSPVKLPARLDSSIYSQIKSLRSSVVKIFTRGHIPNYGQPWRSSGFMDWTGSGYVFERNNEIFILSNAHVVENNLDVRVRLASENDEYPAKVLTVGYQCDLAVLQVCDPRFLSKAKPLALGEMVTEGQEVAVLGFPMGGLELSFTTGPVSRIQVDEYSLSGEYNLQAQTQAPTNPGNSGGPVMSDGKIVGVAFQTNEQTQGMHYFIPVPVMRHFIDDAFSPSGYKGFPDIAMNLQDLTGDSMRAYYGLQDGQSGVRVQSVDNLSNAFGVLQADDIITAIDGIAISHDEKVDVPGIADRLDLNYMFMRKQIGENVKVSILRRNPLTNELEKKAFRIQLDKRPGETKKIGPVEFDKNPTYFFHSGVLFQPLTPNYLESSEGLKFRAIRSQQDECMTEIQSKKIGEQFVIVNTVLKCDSTFGGHDFENMLVKEVNGIVINNIFDVILALEKPINDLHAIVVDDGFKLVVKNLNQKEHAELLKRYRINKFCSDDLLDKFKSETTKELSTSQHDVESVVTEDEIASASPDLLLSKHTHHHSKHTTVIVTESEGESIGSESESESEDESEMDDFIDRSDEQPRSAIIKSESNPLVARTQGMSRMVNVVNNLQTLCTNAATADHKHKRHRKIVESESSDEEEIAETKVASRRKARQLRM